MQVFCHDLRVVLGVSAQLLRHKPGLIMSYSL
jgi:hypothetical protein